MLQNLNRKLKGWASWFLAIIIAVIFIMWGAQGIISLDYNSNEDKVIAKVGEEELTYNELKQRTIITLSSAGLPKENIEQYYDLVYPQLLEEKKLISQSKMLNISLTNNVIFNIMKKFTDINQIRDMQILNAYKANIYKTLIITPPISYSYITTEKSYKFITNYFSATRKIKTLSIELNDLSQKVSVNDDEIKQYYEENKDNLIIPEKFSIEYISYGLSDILKTIAIDEQAIEAYYNDNKANFINPKSWSLSYTILNSKDYEDITKTKNDIVSELSNNSKTLKEISYITDKDNIVESTWIESGSANPLVEEKLKNMKPNDITDLIIDEDQHLIIKLLDFKEEEEKLLDDSYAEIKELLMSEKANNKLDETFEEVDAISFSKPDSLKHISTQVGIKTSVTKAITLEEFRANEKFANDKLHESFTSEDVQKRLFNSPVVYVNDNTIVVYRIKEIFPRHQSSLDESLNKIKEILISEKSKYLFDSIIVELKNSIKNKQSISEIISKYNLTFKEKTINTYFDNKVEIKLKELAFAMQPVAGTQQLELQDDKAILIELIDISNNDVNKQTEESISYYYGNNWYNVFSESMNNKVQTNIIGY